MAKPNQSEEERAKQKAEFIEYFEEVPVIKYAAMYVQISEQTAHDWLKKDPEFLSQVERAKSKWAKKRALKTRAEFQLERLDKEIWSEEKKIKVEVDPVKEILKGYGLDVGEDQASEGTTPKEQT